MPPRRVLCQICNVTLFKYTCANCRVVYCSVPCYKEHMKSSCTTDLKAAKVFSDTANLLTVGPAQPEDVTGMYNDPPLEEPNKLKPLTTLKWPNVEPPPVLPDPLTANEPKPLQMPHYEAIATSSKIRTLLNENPQLPKTLKALDNLSGNERERAFERILGVSADMVRAPGTHRSNGLYWLPEGTNEEDMETLRTFMRTLSTVMLAAEEQMSTDRQFSPVALEPAD